MKEFPDDELDKLFRKSSEELDSTFDPDDWNALKRKLDEQDGKTPAAILKKWWPAGLLALLFVAALTTYVFTGKEENEKPKASQIAVENRLPGKTTRPGADPAAPPTGKVPLEGSPSKIKTEPRESEADSQLPKFNAVQPQAFAAGKPSEEIVNHKTENKKKLPRRWSKTGGVYLEPDRSIGRRVDGATYLNNKIPPTPGVERSNGGRDEHVVGKWPGASAPDGQHMPEQATVSNQDHEQHRLLITADLLKPKSFIVNEAGKLPAVQNAGAPKVSERVEAAGEEEQEPTPKFAVRFGYSPDLSSVGLKNFTKPGTAVSLLVEYSFLPKLYFQTGLIRSSKGYNAMPGEYEWPSSWNDQKILPTSVDAICKVIEVPLNVRFDIAQNDRSRWFAGAGASSYYMQKEKYDYNYPPHSYNIKWYEYETSTGWYWLSHLNASAGYEYRFSKKLSLLAEPYVRVPIKKVGYGKVSLFSTGVWFSIRYTPVFK